MTHDEKIAHLMENLKAHGMDPKLATPPKGLLHAMGVQAPPQLFHPVLVGLCLTAAMLVLFPIVFILIALVFLLIFGYVPWTFPVFLLIPALGGLLKVWQEAGKWANAAQRLKLPAWKDYPKQPPREENASPEPTPHAAQPDKWANTAQKLKLPAWKDYPKQPHQGENASPEPTPHAAQPDERCRAKE
jgi:hypothetical protein